MRKSNQAVFTAEERKVSGVSFIDISIKNNTPSTPQLLFTAKIHCDSGRQFLKRFLARENGIELSAAIIREKRQEVKARKG